MVMLWEQRRKWVIEPGLLMMFSKWNYLCLSPRDGQTCFSLLHGAAEMEQAEAQTCGSFVCLGIYAALMYYFSNLEPVCCSMSSSNWCFLSCIQISQETGQVIWYSHLLKNFPQFLVIHTVKGFGIVSKAEIDVFFELSCFFNDPAYVGNLIFGSSVFSKSSLYHMEVLGSWTAEAWLGEFWALLY